MSGPAEKAPLLNQRYQKHPPPRTARPTRSLHISISLLILAAFVLYAQRQGISKSKVPYEVGPTRALPDLYGICSKEGKKVYTVPEEGGVGGVECLVVGGKEVVDTGSLGNYLTPDRSARIRRRWGEKATVGAVEQSPQHVQKAGELQIIYLPQGHTLTPGLVDSHAHPLRYGHSRQLQLQGSTCIGEVIRRVEAFVQNNASSLPDGAWIEGLGWDQNLWEVKEFPTAADLDASPILRGLPISLTRIDVHAEWVSSAVLELLGDLPGNVDGGVIVRDEDGKPTGVFVDNAVDLLEAVRPPWTDVQREAYLNIMTDDSLSKGLTGVHDARVPAADLAFYKRMADEGKLPIRFYSMVYCEYRESYCGDSIPKIDNAADGRLNVKSVKLFADGALGSRGAALLDDYSDRPGWNGFLLTREEVWKPLIKAWYDGGWQVNVHAIGDRANHVVLNAIEAVMGDDLAAGKERRFRLEHAQIMTEDDLKRAVRLGVIASYQPTHATSDMWYAEQRLGSERMKGAYAWRSYLDLGGRITLGSDFPVESIDPLRGYYAAVTRRAEDGSSPHGRGGWYPQQKLTPAFASFSNMTGSLTPGKRFDAVIWDDDLMSVDEDEMLDVRVKATIVDGQLAWGRIKA